MFLTWLDSNTWLIEVAGVRILLDPWLVGPLTFGGMEWLFKAERLTPRSIPPSIDLILLSQGLADHAHPPTLAQLDRHIPVVASPGATKVVQALGYLQVTTLQHHQVTEILPGLMIEALPGSPVGPNTRENAYLLTDQRSGTTLYYEPHGYHDPALQQKTPVDVVITPTIDLVLPLLGTVIKGQSSAIQVCEWLRPQFLLPTAAGGDLRFEGWLLKILKAEGTTAALQQQLNAHNLSATQVLAPQPWERMEIDLPLRLGN